MQDNPFLTTEEVIDYLHVNVRTVYRLVKAGHLPAVRVGRQWRFRKSEVEAWLRRREASKAGTENRLRVLAVDDDESIRNLVAGTLSDRYDVETVPDGHLALERLDQTGYDLLITDLRMSGKDGLSLIRDSRLRFQSLRMVIMTGHSTEASAIEAINLGVTGYLTKPFTKRRLLAVVARALGQDPPVVAKA